MNVKPVEKLVFFISKMYNTKHRKVNTLKNKLVKLFFSTLYLSAFTFGGGYVIVSLMRKKFVDNYHWIDEDEMLDLVAIAQSAPGPIAVNGAIVVGYKRTTRNIHFCASHNYSSFCDYIDYFCLL